MLRIPANESTPTFDETHTVTLREWVAAGRAERRKWRALPRKAKIADHYSSDARAAAEEDRSTRRKVYSPALEQFR